MSKPPSLAPAHDIRVHHVAPLPGGALVATVRVGDIQCGVHFVRDGRAPALVAIADEDLKARIRAAVLAHEGGRA